MTIEIFNQQKELSSTILEEISNSEEHKEQIKGLFLKLFDMYLKKEQGWRHTDEFKEIIKQL
jgi:hypothetical protein